MPEWITPVVTVVAIFISFFLGSLQSRASYKKQQTQLRYDSFYIPFIRNLYYNELYIYDFSEIGDAERDILIKITLDNLQHLGRNSQMLFPDFYFTHKTVQSQKYSKPYNDAFDKFANAVIKEANSLCRQLTLEPMTVAYEKEYSQRGYVRTIKRIMKDAIVKYTEIRTKDTGK